MAFNVSYIFTARDKYSAIAKKVAASNQDVKKTAAQASQTIKTKFTPALSSLKVKASETKTQIKQLASTIKTNFEPAMRSVRNVGLGMTAAVTLPFVLAANSAVNLASDAEETRSKFATVFRDLGSGSETVADDFAKNFGLAGSTARMLIGDTGDLLTGFGFTQEKALDLSREVNELAVDLASFTNFSGGAEGASAALTKALLGERESLKSLGVAISEDLVKKKIAQLQSEGNKFASLAEAKAVATLRIAVEQSKNAVGDYSRTQAGAANVSRLLGEKTKELQESYGKLLLPMQVKINKALIAVIDRLNALSPTTKKIILVVGGLVAALGPLLLIVGSVALALPVLAAGFAAVGTALTFLTGPVGIIIALAAALAFFLIKSKAVRAFFSGIALGIKESIGPALTALTNDIRKAASIITGLFGSGSETDESLSKTNNSLMALADAGRLVGRIIGVAFDGVITTLRAIGALIGQIVGAIATLNFKNFDFGAVTDKFKGFADRVGIDSKSIVDGVKGIGERFGIGKKAEVPDQVAALKLAPEMVAAIPQQTAALKLVPDAVADIPDQTVAVSVLPNVITDQTAALKLVPETVVTVPDQTAALKVVPEMVAAIPQQTAALKLIPDADSLQSLQAASTVNASPAVATANARATVNGQITVSATEGARVDSVQSDQKFKGAQGNVGVGAAA